MRSPAGQGREDCYAAPEHKAAQRTERLAQHSLRLHAHALEAIDDDQGAVGDAQRGRHLCSEREQGTKPRAPRVRRTSDEKST